MARKITDEDLANRGVMGLPDVPGLTAIEMQKKLEEIPREVIIPRYNELVDSVADICEEFSKLSTYDVGDYCIYENVLYKCVDPVTVEGDWDSTKWIATSVTKEIASVNSNLVTELQSGCILAKNVNTVTMNGFSTNIFNLKQLTIPTDYRPNQMVTAPLLLVYHDKTYSGYIEINTTGSILAYFFTTYAGPLSSADSGTVSFSASWTV